MPHNYWNYFPIDFGLIKFVKDKRNSAIYFFWKYLEAFQNCILISNKLLIFFVVALCDNQSPKPKPSFGDSMDLCSEDFDGDLTMVG